MHEEHPALLRMHEIAKRYTVHMLVPGDALSDPKGEKAIGEIRSPHPSDAAVFDRRVGTRRFMEQFGSGLQQ